MTDSCVHEDLKFTNNLPLFLVYSKATILGKHPGNSYSYRRDSDPVKCRIFKFMR